MASSSRSSSIAQWAVAIGAAALVTYTSSRLVRRTRRATETKKTNSSSAAAAAGAPKPIVVVGSVNADIYIECDRLPARGETYKVKDSSGYVRGGGKGANQAAGIAKLLHGTSGSVKYCGRFGSDLHAPSLLAKLNATGCDTSLCTNVDGATGQAFVVLYTGGDNSVILVGGANQKWDDKLDEQLVVAIQNASILVLQREIPQRINTLAAQVAFKAGVPVMLDMGGEDSPLDDALLSCLRLLSANETELQRATGLPTDNEQEMIVAARALQSKGVKNVLISLGKRGSLLIDATGGLTRFAAYAVAPSSIVDTTGAGDCFRAAFAVAAAEGRDIAKGVLPFASAAASLKIQRSGATDGMPLRHEVITYLQQLGVTLAPSSTTFPLL